MFGDVSSMERLFLIPLPDPIVDDSPKDLDICDDEYCEEENSCHPSHGEQAKSETGQGEPPLGP